MIYIVLDSGIEVFFLYLVILNKGNEDLNTVDSEIEGKTRLRGFINVLRVAGLLL